MIRRLLLFTLITNLFFLNAFQATSAFSSEEYMPGETYWGEHQYIEYIAGDLPIIIGGPHAGYLKPPEIPKRSWGTMSGDKYSQEYARAVADYIEDMTCGGRPHVILNKLHRTRLDANRDKKEAAQHPLSKQAWDEFQGYIADAKSTVTAQYGKGHYYDFHTHVHPDIWIEFGLALYPNRLNVSDNELKTSDTIRRSSLRTLGSTEGIYFPEVVRGKTSMGGLMQARGFETVPSPKNPGPGDRAYYVGGYNTWVHGSRYGGPIDATQVEVHSRIVREEESRDAFSYALAESIVDFVETHYKFDLKKRCKTPRPTKTATPTKTPPPTQTPTPTNTPQPTKTPTPTMTNTPQPTETPLPPTPTATHTSEPVPTSTDIPTEPTESSNPDDDNHLPDEDGPFLILPPPIPPNEDITSQGGNSQNIYLPYISG